MEEFRLEPVDVLVSINDHYDPFSIIERWAVGPYDHVFLYLGKLFLGDCLSNGIPMLFESNGRGVVLQSLSNRYGEKVVVMRLKSEHDRLRISYVIDEAIKLASEPQAYYDYSAFVLYVLPRLILEKLYFPIPLCYHRDIFMICSEACVEVYWRAGLDILSKEIVPLPADFISSPLLGKVYEGRLTDSLI